MKILVRTNNMPNMIYVSVKQQVKSFFGKNFRFNAAKEKYFFLFDPPSKKKSGKSTVLFPL